MCPFPNSSNTFTTNWRIEQCENENGPYQLIEYAKYGLKMELVIQFKYGSRTIMIESQLQKPSAIII